MKLGREEILQELRRFYKLPETRMGPQGTWRDMSLSFGFSAEWVARWGVPVLPLPAVHRACSSKCMLNE